MDIPIVYGVVVAGPPGCGKSTFVAALAAHYAEQNRPSLCINLDVANEDTPYQAAIHVHDLLQFDLNDASKLPGQSERPFHNVMRSGRIGPNAAFMLVADSLAANPAALIDKIRGLGIPIRPYRPRASTNPLDVPPAQVSACSAADAMRRAAAAVSASADDRDGPGTVPPDASDAEIARAVADTRGAGDVAAAGSYLAGTAARPVLIFDAPGQTELTLHSRAMRSTIDALQRAGVSLCIAHLSDAVALTQPPSHLISALATATAGSVFLEAPAVFVLTKSDAARRAHIPLTVPLESFESPEEAVDALTEAERWRRAARARRLAAAGVTDPDAAEGARSARLPQSDAIVDALLEVVADFKAAAYVTSSAVDRGGMKAAAAAVDRANGYELALAAARVASE